MNYGLEQYYKMMISKWEDVIEEDKETLAEHIESLEAIKAEYEDKLNEDMNADDTEHAKAYEADIRRGL